ncbi:MAG: glycosyltransferase family 32 protein [Shimia sp.]|uniref:glycosyltransferase family 32 protein n=1 Tax=Shimia sp. TaxID=1954381 RepID=UPI004059D0C6
MDRPMRRWVLSWQKQNPDWHVSFNDDYDCLALIRDVFPHYLETYLTLNPVEKSDFWRILVVLHLGGLYTDADTTCRKPLSDWIDPSDEAVIGIDGDYLNRFPNWQPSGHLTSGGAYNLELPWRDNVVAFSNWTFAFRPGHEILAETARRIEINASDPFFTADHPDWTIKKTGPGVFTDVIYDWLAARGHSAPELVRHLRKERAIVIDGVRFVDRPAFHTREVRHFGMGSWKPMSVVVAWRKLSRHWL